MSTAYHETKAQSLTRLCNISYGDDIRAINGALDAVAECYGKTRTELANMLRDEFVDFEDDDEDES